MAMLVIRTQVLENYGDADKPYWKPKGGAEHKILGVPLNINFAEVVAAAGVESNNDFFQEYVIDWSVESDDYLSWFEKSQLEYDGTITFKEPTMEYSAIAVVA